VNNWLKIEGKLVINEYKQRKQKKINKMMKGTFKTCAETKEEIDTQSKLEEVNENLN
jgi:RNA polymerase-binding transcription factor DksA